jgi:hypothetical protein
MEADGADTFLEFGAGSALVGMVRRIVPAARAAAVNDRSTLDAAVAELERSRAGSAVASA